MLWSEITLQGYFLWNKLLENPNRSLIIKIELYFIKLFYT